MTVSPQTYAEGTDGAPPIGFVARTVTLDNYSNSWLWIGAARRYLRPFTTAVFPLSTPVDVGEIMWRTPPGILQPAASGGQLLAYWNDQALPPTQPQPIFASQTEPTVVLTITGNVGPLVMPVPAGTLAIAVLIDPLDSTTITIQGNVTLIRYFDGIVVPAQSATSAFALKVTSAIAVPFDPRDTQVMITATASSIGGGRSVDVVAYPFIPAEVLATTVGAIGVTQAQVTAGSVLGGSVNGAGTIITIPVGGQWKGSGWISAEGAGTSTQMQISGAGATPATGTVLAAVNVPAGGQPGTISVPDIYVVAGANPVNIIIAVAGAPTFNAGAIGLLL